MTTPVLPYPPQAVIVDTTHSPYARLRPVPIDAVVLEDTFWRPRRELNRTVVIPRQFKACEETGRIDNLRRAAGMKDGEFEGVYFNDSDVYKLLETAAWQLAGARDPNLEHTLDDMAVILAAAQQPDGYLNSYFMGERAKDRFANFDLHEMYCAGHLIQAAIAYYRTTGKTNLLHVAIKLADLLCATFGPESEGKRFGTDGHPEIELAMVELYRVTNDKKYLDQARYFIDARGYGRLGKPFNFWNTDYAQDNIPFRERTHLEGHAVRAIYLNCGATDVCAETTDHGLYQALERMWDSMTQRQMYIHGGLGPRYENEGFGRDYELPNTHAHAESCAAVSNVMWNWRLLLRNADARYTDIMELALYNNVLAGIAQDGTRYFYQNPLDSDGAHTRQAWFFVACCPSNISRTIAALPGYVYTTTTAEAAVWVHLYVASLATLTLPNGSTVRLRQITDYPWSGDIELRVLDAFSGSIYLRLPYWCGDDWSVTVNGQAITPELTTGHYLHLAREWQADDRIMLTLPMLIRRVECNPLVSENMGKVALMRGPLLYCVEAADHAGIDVRGMGLSNAVQITATHRADLLGGITVLQAPASVPVVDEPWDNTLYRTVPPHQLTLTRRAIQMTAIPYFAWDNRAEGTMQVWLEAQP